MLFNGHTMSMVNDLRIIQNEIRNVDFVTVAAITTSTYPDMPNIYYAGILIPPTEMLMEWVDGNQSILQTEYPKYLMEKDCDDMITALIAAMTKKNIILYIPKDEYDCFGQILLQHIYYVYGITCNTPFSQFYVNQAKIPFLLSKFYMMNVMDPNDYLATYPANYILPDIVVNKLAEDLHPFNQPATFEQYRDYFNKLNASKAVRREPVMMTKAVEKS